MPFVRGFGKLLNYAYYSEDNFMEIPFSPSIRTSYKAGNSLYDFESYIRTSPQVEIQTLIGESGSPGLFDGVEASTTYAWILSEYPKEVGRIGYDVYCYSDAQGSNPYYLGYTTVSPNPQTN